MLDLVGVDDGLDCFSYADEGRDAKVGASRGIVNCPLPDKFHSISIKYGEAGICQTRVHAKNDWHGLPPDWKYHQPAEATQRNAAGKTVAQVAKALGVTSESYEAVEAGEKKLSAFQFSRWRKVLGIAPDKAKPKQPTSAPSRRIAVKEDTPRSPRPRRESSSDRSNILERAAQILGSHRIATKEAEKLLYDMEKRFVNTLLGFE